MQQPTVSYKSQLIPRLSLIYGRRVIGLCDMDAFYAQCEQKRLEIDPSRVAYLFHKKVADMTQNYQWLCSNGSHWYAVLCVVASPNS